jgi:hypothetical protein
MGIKKRYTNQLNWQSTSPAPFNANTQPSGVLLGGMASTNTIYTNIIDISNTDNQGLEITWTGTPTGTIQVMVSESGTNFYALTFSPALAQPNGSAGGFAVDLNQVPWRYLMVQYTNATGTGTLNVWLGSKDLN